MTGYSSPSEQLWYFAQQLVEEEAKTIPFTEQEVHGHRIQTKYNQLVSNLTCLGDIIATMYQKEKLTLKEFEQIQHLQSTPIRANEELLNIIARSSRDVFECFLSLIKDTNQLHLYQMLVSGDDTSDKAKREDAWDHKDLIRRNFMWLSEKLDTESGLISLLYQQNVLTIREREDIFCTNNSLRKSLFLLGLLSKKPPEDFEKFLEALEDSGQGHLAKKLKNPEGSSDDFTTVSSAVSTPKSISTKLLPKEVHKSRQTHVPGRSFSRPVLPPKMLPKFGQKLIPFRSMSKPAPPPKPGTQSTSAEHCEESVRAAEKTANFRRTEGVKFQSRLKGLESRLHTDIAVKVTYISLFYFDKPGDNLKMCFHALLQECHQMQKDFVTRNVKTNMELEQLRKSARQSSAAATLNEVFRTQLHSMQQELTTEKLQSKKERIHLEEKINKQKTEIHNEKVKCKRFEDETLLNNCIIMETEDKLKKTERDKLFYQQQMHEINDRLASTEYELQKSKENFEESNTKVISLMTECEKLNEACEILKKENDIMNDLDVQLHQTQEISRGLLKQLYDRERSLELAEEEKFELIKLQKETVKEKLLENDRNLKLLEDLDIEKHRRQDLEDKLSNAGAQQEQLNRKLEGREIIFLTQESQVIRNNHQFIKENIKSSRLVDLLHQKNCITDEERDHLSNHPSNFCKNDALLQWMRTITFQQDKGQQVLECFRQTKQNFVADLLEKGGVLIKSKISTELVKESLYLNSPSKKVLEFKVIEILNQLHGLSLSGRQNLTSEITDDGIVIVPFCHQEANGIVIWFWCQSRYGQRKLQRMYETGILLQKLTTIFIEFSIESELLVATSITLFEGDFTKDGNGLPDKYKSYPVLIEKISTKASEERKKSITGLTILGKELFVVSEESSEVEVYDSIYLSFSRRWKLKELIYPWDIGSCNRNRCLYIFDGKGIDQSREILRVDANGNLIKIWSTGDDYGYGLSVTDESNVILTVYSKNKLNEYSPDGQLIREINLSSEAEILWPWHAIKLPNGHFVVSHGSGCDDLFRVCIVGADGKPQKSFGVKRGSNIGQMNLPVYLSVDENGFVMVAVQGHSRVLLLDSDLKFIREMLWREKHKLRFPRRILLDESNGRMLVADNKWTHDGRVLIFQLCF